LRSAQGADTVSRGLCLARFNAGEPAEAFFGNVNDAERSNVSIEDNQEIVCRWFSELWGTYFNRCGRRAGGS
jgi:hypothetical protein